MPVTERDMATDHSDDPTAVGKRATADERERGRSTHFDWPATRKLALLGGILSLLAATLPMYWLYPASTASALPGTDPAAATPTVATLAALGGGLVVLAVVVVAGATLYRLERGPLTQREALAVHVAEDAATYIGFVTGGVATAVAVALFALGLGGAGVVETYTSVTGGHDPFARSAYDVTVLHAAALGFWGAVAAVTARWHVRRRQRTPPRRR